MTLKSTSMTFKFLRGKGVTEYILILLLMIPLAVAVARYGTALFENVALHARMLSEDEVCFSVRQADEDTLRDLGYYYDARVDRFRHRRTGRFVRAALLDREVCK